ncbi:MAG: alanine racemase [Bacteroidia bacterium]|nr:MAG: alanine racemase [Bacteroidia bacterium]
MFNTSYIEISRKAYRNNIRYLKKIIGKDARFSSVVKGNAYGHGVENIVPLAEEAGVRHFSVFSAREANDVLNVIGKGSQIMIMGLLDDEEIEWAISNDIEFFVFDMDRLGRAIETARMLRKKARIHVEVETGFNRTGFEYDRMPDLVSYLKEQQEHFILEGLCTHYAGAESLSNYLRIKNQITLFRKFNRYFSRHNLHPLFRHTACSAAALTYPSTIMEMVRFGIAQYGFWPSPETHMFRFQKDTKDSNPLRRMISWKSKVMVLKDVEAGNFVGYGSSYLANKKMKIAIIPVGYANGFSRALSNTGRVLIRGRRVPVIGTVTMNTMTVNVTDIPGVQRGDEVVIIGKQNRLSISISSFCEMSEQLNYQLLTRLPADIPRFIVE